MNTLAVLLGFASAIYIALWGFNTAGIALLGYVGLGLAFLCIPLGFYAIAADYDVLQHTFKRDDDEDVY